MDNGIDFVKIFKRLIKKIWVIITATVLAGLAGIMFTLVDTPNVYSAEVSLYSVSVGSYYDSIQGFNAMMDYAEIVGSKKVADRVVNALPEYELDAKLIQSMVKASYGENSAIFYVYAYSSDPELAKLVANAMAESFVLEVSNITGADNVKILDEADSVFVSYDAETQKLQTRLIFTAAGFILICAVISIYEIFSKKVKEVDDCTLNGEVRLLGVIPKHNI